MTDGKTAAAVALAETVAELVDDIREAMPPPPGSSWSSADQLGLSLALYDAYADDDGEFPAVAP